MARVTGRAGVVVVLVAAVLAVTAAVAALPAVAGAAASADPPLAGVERARHHEVQELARAVAARLRAPAARRAGAFRRADPGAQVVLAGLTNRSWIDLRQVYAAGGRRYFDAAAHPFSPRVSKVVKIAGWCAARCAAPGDARKRLVVTEMSWSSGRGLAAFTYGWETPAGR
jgi:hypothetical protein